MLERVLVAMSGGVDSSATALLLLEQGYECIGVTMRLFDRERAEGSIDCAPGSCGDPQDIVDAREVCKLLGIEHRVLDGTKRFEECVVRPFIDSYLAGETPNPCIFCNRHLKFDALLSLADELGCDLLATGHYAQVAQMPDGRMALRRGADPAKDQSYVLYMLSQSQLARVRFPLGALDKAAVRELAAAHGFPTAHKQDSQDICFIPDGDVASFIERHGGVDLPHGDILDTQGNVVGKHKGAALYTIGQRKGLGVALGEPVYVCARDVQANTLTVGPRSALMSDGCSARAWNWMIAPPAIGEAVPCTVKTNYRQSPHPATLTAQSDGSVLVRYETPQPKAASGQAAVAYDGDLVIGGGTITSG